MKDSIGSQQKEKRGSFVVASFRNPSTCERRRYKCISERRLFSCCLPRPLLSTEDAKLFKLLILNNLLYIS